MKVTTTISIDHLIKKKGLKIITEKLNSNLSQEVENYLKMLIDAEECKTN